MDWKKHIVSDEKILLGKPIIKGTRISVELILELFSNGWDESMILESYPNLKKEHIKSVFMFLRDCIEHEHFFSLPKHTE